MARFETDVPLLLLRPSPATSDAGAARVRSPRLRSAGSPTHGPAPPLDRRDRALVSATVKRDDVTATRRTGRPAARTRFAHESLPRPLPVPADPQSVWQRPGRDMHRRIDHAAACRGLSPLIVNESAATAVAVSLLPDGLLLTSAGGQSAAGAGRLAAAVLGGTPAGQLRRWAASCAPPPPAYRGRTPGLRRPARARCSSSAR